MTVSLLEQFLVGELFAFLLIFVRIGTGVMLLPGIGEAYVSPRIRLLFALAISLVLVPLYSDIMPEIPGSPLALLVLLSAEILVGSFIGVLCRMMVTTMHIAGTIIAFQSSLAMASMFDVTAGGQSTVVGNFMTMAAVVLFFTLDLHHVMLNGLADSYTLFPPGTYPIIGDMAQHLMQVLGEVFLMAVKLSAPHIIFAVLFYLCAGVLARLMPSFQVFFVFMPAQIGIAFFLLLALFTAIMTNYSEFVEDSLRAFLDHE